MGPTSEVRRLLRELLEGPLRFTPQADGTYRFTGAIAEAVVAGLVGQTCLASPGGLDDMYDVLSVAWFVA
jgi:hypothetical protein